MIDALEPVAEPADARLQRAHDVAGADDLVPARQHLAAQQRAAAQRRLDLSERVARRPASASARSSAAAASCSIAARSTTSGAHRQARERTAQRPADERRARLRVGGEPVEPGAHGPERVRGQQLLLERRPRGRRARPRRRAAPSRASAAGAPAPPAPASSGTRLSTTESAVPRSRAERQELPRHGVRVAGGGRDEEPPVRGGEQLVRERAVLGEHGVDVGRVEQREPGRKRCRRHQLQRSRRAGAAGHPRKARQDPLALERRQVLRVAREHRRPRRGAEDAGRADDRADQAVEERRLAGPGRAADHDQCRGVELPQPRQDVVVDLGDQVVADAPRLVRTRDVELEPHGAEVFPEPLERHDRIVRHGSPVPGQRRAEACADR